jgi:hypothetical protein
VTADLLWRLTTNWRAECRESRLFGSEGGPKLYLRPYPYPALRALDQQHAVEPRIVANHVKAAR